MKTIWKRSARSRLNSWLCAALVVAAMNGCGTVAPDLVRDRQPSWDGGAQNSGIIALRPDRSALITKHLVDRYLALVQLGYGRDFVPPILPTTTNDKVFRAPPGVHNEGTNWVIDAEHLVKFGVMNERQKSGEPGDAELEQESDHALDLKSPP